MIEEDAPNKPDDPVEEALDQFREAYFGGEVLDPEQFCENYPECGPKLRDEIESFLIVAGGFPSVDPEKDEMDHDVAEEVEPKKPNIMGDFRIIREIGRGGMGIVYEAEQISLNRKVALKVLPIDLGFCDDAVLKFRREAEAGGRQSHPSVVAVYSTGEQGGRYYIAQELVGDGYTLADRLDDLRKGTDLPKGYFREAAELVAKVADALEHAHASGVIHRDIKPSNILLTSQDQPKITDFGLAKLEDAMALSRTGDFSGTPFYMSPEQVTGRGKGVDRRTDIYSLGVTLYEMLTLRQPFDGESSYEVLKQIPFVDPPDPWRVNPRVPRDLSTICLKAMEKSPDKRYPSVKDFAEDLRRFLSGEVVLARPAGTTTKILKRIKRNPVLSSAVGAAVLAMLVLLVWGVVYFIQVKSSYDEISRLFDLNLVSRLTLEADELWPAYPRNIGNLRRWLSEARGLLSRCAGYRSELDRLEKKDQLRTKEGELKNFLNKLIFEIDTLGNEETGVILDVAERLHFAETVHEESIDKYKKDWERAVESIASIEECPQYNELHLEPQIGLVPLGRDPLTGLWEFAHLQTGQIPERDAEERLILTEEMGLVFVLLPGGPFRMGALRPDDQHREGDPYVDPNCDIPNETPVREVLLDPFFISKYEMTQGQWKRFTRSNPSTFPPNWRKDNEIEFTLRHPVEMLNWNDCLEVLGRLDLVMPFEAQWEYAYRGGTTTIWYTGNDPNSLEGYENIVDAANQNYEDSAELKAWVKWEDDFVYHAPVGSFKANPFGLHDMGGNLCEWCSDIWAEMNQGILSSGDGSRRVPENWNSMYDSPTRPLRGGAFYWGLVGGRATKRSGQRPVYCSYVCGVRPAKKLQ